MTPLPAQIAPRTLFGTNILKSGHLFAAIAQKLPVLEYALEIFRWPRDNKPIVVLG